MDAPGHLQMIDLSPQPQDKSSGTAELRTPRHDAVPGCEADQPSQGPRRRHLSYEHAEAGIQRLSRWAGPAVLLVALGAIGWLLFG
ncbi:MAG TPA: hypothetical protein VJM09_00535 [Sphingobium sp.]|nr:hypothetical protein [Sphingobium sp.]